MVNEIVICDVNGEKNWAKAGTITALLVDEGYAVMTTTENDLIVLNFIAAYDAEDFSANRNNVIFKEKELTEVIV